MALTAVRLAPIIERSKREILEDIEAGTVPSTVATFSELHDYVDANEYGGLCEEDSIVGAYGGWVDDANKIQNAVNAWLVAGR